MCAHEFINKMTVYRIEPKNETTDSSIERSEFLISGEILFERKNHQIFCKQESIHYSVYIFNMFTW